jgi:hypothetical protein
MHLQLSRQDDEPVIALEAVLCPCSWRQSHVAILRRGRDIIIKTLCNACRMAKYGGQGLRTCVMYPSASSPCFLSSSDNCMPMPDLRKATQAAAMGEIVGLSVQRLCSDTGYRPIGESCLPEQR